MSGLAVLSAFPSKGLQKLIERLEEIWGIG